MASDRLNPLFIGHGSPLNAITDNRYAEFLRELGASLPKPEAILVVSAHWQTPGTRITASASPRQIHDFFGFPDELYALRYAPPGHPDLAREIARSIPGVELDEARGIDHAGWAPVCRMYPEADVPLLELSLDRLKGAREHYELGKRLADLSSRGVLIIGSGNVVHNLGDVSFEEDARPFDWALEADAWIAQSIASGNDGDLVEYRARMPLWRRAIPTDEHFLPLLYVLATREGGGNARTIYEEIQNGSVSMRSVEAS
jgi:4,5-DOPA dioxygenase extradiol